MNNEIQEVVRLQSQWSSQNTPAMEERGRLIRDRLPALIAEQAAELSAALGIAAEDLVIEGRDGTGLKSAVPWVRFGSRSRSPSANSGWYCVLLFRPQADGVYLCLSHASTVWDGGDFRPRPIEETQRLMAWGRSVLQGAMPIGDLDPQIDLNSVNRLARAYETTTLVAKFFDTHSLSSGPDISSYLTRFCRLLATIYEYDRLLRSPDAIAQEFALTEEAVRRLFSTKTEASRVQGFGLSASERKAVELHAMQKARAYLEALEFDVRDHSANSPFDFIARRGEEEIIVEVKGTTGLGATVILTHGEVSAHAAAFPNNALVIVHSIELDKAGPQPLASGGELNVRLPWKIEDDALRAIAYQYTLAS